MTAAIPYTVFPSGLLCHHGRNISFCHDNYRDFFAAFHIANVVYGLYSGIDLAALSPDAQEVFLLQLETLDNSILFDAISILRQYFGLSIYDISAQDTTDLSDTCAQIALPAILIRLLDAVIRRGELSKNEHSQLCQLRSTLCERFVLSFKALDESDPLQTKYCLFFSLALSMLARDYRTGVAGTRDLIKCAGYAQQCINGEKKLNIPKADGYLQVALCLNARMEDMLNVTDTKMNGTLPFSSQLADAVREAVRDYHEDRCTNGMKLFVLLGEIYSLDGSPAWAMFWRAATFFRLFLKRRMKNMSPPLIRTIRTIKRSPALVMSARHTLFWLRLGQAAVR